MPLEVAEVALRVTRFLNPIGFENPKYMRSELSTTNTPKQMHHANRGRFHTLRTTGTKRALCGQHLVHQNQIVDHSSHDSALNAAQRKMQNSFIFLKKTKERGCRQVTSALLSFQHLQFGCSYAFRFSSPFIGN